MFVFEFPNLSTFNIRNCNVKDLNDNTLQIGDHVALDSIVYPVWCSSFNSRLNHVDTGSP